MGGNPPEENRQGFDSRWTTFSMDIFCENIAEKKSADRNAVGILRMKNYFCTLSQCSVMMPSTRR